MLFPHRTLNTDLPLLKINVSPLQRCDLSTSQPGIPAQQHSQRGYLIELIGGAHQSLVILEVMEPDRGLGDRQQTNRAWHPFDHVPLNGFLEEHA
jgi:hypothetical protein